MGKGRASFICVSCAGSQLSEEFANQLRLTTCINTWVDKSGMPRWGQLGCNGFIILDSSMRVVRAKTAAYLQVRERAFTEVESILSKLVKEAAPAAPVDIDTASVKVLKQIISKHGLSYNDCVEKADLQKRAR